jgi:hypothetical protein
MLHDAAHHHAWIHKVDVSASQWLHSMQVRHVKLVFGTQPIIPLLARIGRQQTDQDSAIMTPPSARLTRTRGCCSDGATLGLAVPAASCCRTPCSNQADIKRV